MFDPKAEQSNPVASIMDTVESLWKSTLGAPVTPEQKKTLAGAMQDTAPTSPLFGGAPVARAADAPAAPATAAPEPPRIAYATPPAQATPTTAGPTYVMPPQIPPASGGGGIGAVGRERLATYDERAQAAGAAAQAESRAQQEIAGTQTAAQAEIAATRDEVDAVAKERDASLADQQAKLERMNEELASSKVDPNNFVKSLSTRQMIGWSLGAIFGGARAGLSGGVNQTIARLDAKIGQDIDAQEKALDRKRQAVTNQQGILSITRQRYADKVEAKLAAKDLVLSAYERQVASITANAASETARANGQAAIAEIKEKKLALRQQMAERAAASAAKRRAAMVAESQKVPVAIAGADGRQYVRYVDPKDAEKINENRAQVEVARAKAEGKGAAIPIPGYDGGTSDPVSARTAQKAVGSLNALRGLVREAKELRAQHGGEVIPGAVKDRYQQLTTNIRMLMKNIDELGVLAGPDMQLLESKVPDLDRVDWGSRNTPALLDSLVKDSENNVNAGLNAVGYRPTGARTAAIGKRVK